MHQETSPTASISDVLSNTILLRQTAPYLPIQSLLALAATSRDIRHVLYENRETFRHLDLSSVKKAKVSNGPLDTGGVTWRSQRMDEALTQDEFMSGPLRGLFSKFQRSSVLSHVQTMILDGLGVTAELVDEILSQDRFAVRILSIRSCALNERKLMQALKYSVRASRPEGSPRLKALYYFGPADSNAVGAARIRDQQIPTDEMYGQPASATGIMSSEGAQIGAEWNRKSLDALHTSAARCDDRWYRKSMKS